MNEKKQQIITRPSPNNISAFEKLLRKYTPIKHKKIEGQILQCTFFLYKINNIKGTNGT